MFKYVYLGVNIVTFLLFWLTWMYPHGSPMIIVMVIDDFYVKCKYLCFIIVFIY